MAEFGLTQRPAEPPAAGSNPALGFLQLRYRSESHCVALDTRLSVFVLSQFLHRHSLERHLSAINNITGSTRRNTQTYRKQWGLPHCPHCKSRASKSVFELWSSSSWASSSALSAVFRSRTRALTAEKHSAARSSVSSASEGCPTVQSASAN